MPIRKTAVFTWILREIQGRWLAASPRPLPEITVPGRLSLILIPMGINIFRFPGAQVKFDLAFAGLADNS
jgi:hypothetical protein